MEKSSNFIGLLHFAHIIFNGCQTKSLWQSERGTVWGGAKALLGGPEILKYLIYKVLCHYLVRGIILTISSITGPVQNPTA